MVNLFTVFLSLPILLLGWVFVRKPQTGFRIFNWPFVPPGEDGLTEAGKTPIRARGVFIMAIGLLILVVGLIQ